MIPSVISSHYNRSSTYDANASMQSIPERRQNAQPGSVQKEKNADGDTVTISEEARNAAAAQQEAVAAQKAAENAETQAAAEEQTQEKEREHAANATSPDEDGDAMPEQTETPEQAGEAPAQIDSARARQSAFQQKVARLYRQHSI